MRNTRDQYQRMNDIHTCGTVSSYSPNDQAKSIVFMGFTLLGVKT